MTWVAVAVGVGGAALGAGAAYAGSKKQADASKQAAQMNMDQFHLVNQQQQPYIQSGYGALSRLNTLLGLSPNPNSTPTQSAVPSTGVLMPRNDLSGAWRATPGGGLQRTIAMGPSMTAGGPGGDPTGNNLQLRQILALRAAHGDTQAGRILGIM